MTGRTHTIVDSDCIPLAANSQIYTHLRRVSIPQRRNSQVKKEKATR